MYYCNNFNSLSVLSLYEGELLGVVDKLYFDENLKKVVEVGILSDEGANLSILTKNIYHVGKNAITIKNNQLVSIKTSENTLVSPVNSKAYSLNGEFLGVVKEISFNDKFITEKIILENEQSIDINRLASIGKNAIIFYDENQKQSIKKFTPKSPKIFKSEVEETASIQPVENKSPEIVEPSIEQPSKPIIQSSELLIGRICTKDIYNFNNELLIKENSKLNKKQLKEVIKYGKLRELMLYLK